MILSTTEAAAIAQLDQLVKTAQSFLDDYDYLVVELTPAERYPDEPCYCPYYQMGVAEYSILASDRLIPGGASDELLDWFVDEHTQQRRWA